MAAASFGFTTTGVRTNGNELARPEIALTAAKINAGST
jgi:hypothetical protein